MAGTNYKIAQRQLKGHCDRQMALYNQLLSCCGEWGAEGGEAVPAIARKVVASWQHVATN